MPLETEDPTELHYLLAQLDDYHSYMWRYYKKLAKDRPERMDPGSSRMLKKPASVVLASFRPSTYPRGYASALHSLRPCWTAFLSILLTIGNRGNETFIP